MKYLAAAIGLAVSVGLVSLMVATSTPPTTKPTTPAPTEPTTPAPTKQTTAAAAAEIGDEVALRYPSLTIMCSTMSEASGVYLAGILAYSMTMQKENNAQQAMKDYIAARKLVMRDRRCEQPPSDTMRYRVAQKEFPSGTENVAYCLLPSGRTLQAINPDTGGGKLPCLWIYENGSRHSPFENVRRPAQKGT
jgi:hypothetical protein